MTQDPVKAKIQELCPDIMELKLGCEFTLKPKFLATNSDLSHGVYVVYKSEAGLIGAFHKLTNANIKSWISPIWAEEILGSPITLSVVLRAIKKTFLQQNKPYEEACRIIGNIVLSGDRPHWNLLKDNYDDQTQETKNFIGELLAIRNKD